MNLDEAADELYAVSPEDFMGRRTALAGAAKEAGDRTLAKQITGLRRPTRSAWLVNLVARAEPDRLTELLELGTALQQAQQRMDGDELRRLSRSRRALIDSLAQGAAELGAEHGYDAPDSAVQEVSQTLQAALGDPAVAEVVRSGRLHQAVNYGGFGPDDLASAMAASMPAATRPAGRVGKGAAEPAKDDVETKAAAEKASKARAAADAARAAAQEAEAAAAEATARADELADQVESLRTQLRDTETAEREARETARAARRRYNELLRDAAAAEQAAARAEQA